MTCQIQSLLDLFSRLFQLLQHFCMPALNALTLLVGRQEEHPAYKKLMRRWCGYLSGARCRLFAYGPADAAAIPKPPSLTSFKFKGFTVLVLAYPGYPEKEAVKWV